MNHRRKLNSPDSVSRLLCHTISIAITAVIAMFAAEGGTIVWPTHPRIACFLAVLCAMAAGIAHMRLCAQFDTRRPTQSRVLLSSLLLIFAAVSITLGAIAEYRDLVDPLKTIEPVVLVVSFLDDLLHESARAVVPSCVGCFLEVLPLAALFLTVRKRRRVRRSSAVSLPASNSSCDATSAPAEDDVTVPLHIDLVAHTGE